jgi:hypothetical protein
MPLPQPVIASVTPLSSSALRVAFSTHSEYEDYEIERGGVTVASGVTASPWDDSGLTANTQYSYRVRGRVGEGAPPVTEFALDTFTAETGTSVVSRASDSGHTWVPIVRSDFTITSNRARATGGETTMTQLALVCTPPGANYAVEADVFIASHTNASHGHALMVRQVNENLNRTHYALRYNPSGQGWLLERRINGTSTQLGTTFAFAPTAGITCRVRLQAETLASSVRLRALIDIGDGAGLVERFDLEDTSGSRITDAGLPSCGIVVGSGTTGHHFDFFRAVVI